MSCVDNKMSLKPLTRHLHKTQVGSATGPEAQTTADTLVRLPDELRDAPEPTARALDNEKFSTALLPIREIDATLTAALAGLAGKLHSDRDLQMINQSRQTDL